MNQTLLCTGNDFIQSYFTLSACLVSIFIAAFLGWLIAGLVIRAQEGHKLRRKRK